MNNLNINYPTISLTNNCDRQVTIEFTGGHLRLRPFVESTVKVTVPYNSFSKKLQEIQRRGGKIVNVTIPQFEVGLMVDGDIAPKSIVEVVPAIATNSEADVVAESLPEESLVKSVDESPEPPVTEQVASVNDHVEPLVTEPIVSEDLAPHLPKSPSVAETLAPEIKTSETLVTEGSIVINAEPLSEVKSPKSKTTSKSASGFNKPKASTKAPRAPKKPKS